MASWLTDLKPGVSPKTHVLCAALLWTIIGLLLTQRGITYLVQEDLLLAAVAGIILGSLKSRYILDKSAMQGVERIKQFADNTCIGAVYSWKTWVLVVAMMLFGLLVRSSPIPKVYIGIICIAIGWALIRSSRFGWKAWFNWKSSTKI